MPSWVLRFPDLGEGIDEGEVIRWLVGVADHVHVDQAVCEVETNKVNTELTTAYEGTVLALHAAAGVRLRRGDALVTLELRQPDPGVVGVVPSPGRAERRVRLRPPVE